MKSKEDPQQNDLEGAGAPDSPEQIKKLAKEVIAMESLEQSHHEALYNNHSGYLDSILEQKRMGFMRADAKTIGLTSKKLEERMLDEELSDDEFEGLQEVQALLRELATYNGSKNKEKVLERLGRNKLFSLVRTGQNLDDLVDINKKDEGNGNGGVYTAVWQMAKAAEEMARSRFPEDVKKQEKEYEAQDAERIEKVRKKLGGYNVS